ncbi:MAG: hypothetical protein MI923_08205 [Phycisphaerales bacterium]|nr:hypothetical protein [Phycisphaerales bacterium]
MRDHNEIVFDDETGDVVSIETTNHPIPVPAGKVPAEDKEEKQDGAISTGLL